jgi:hypothetical protein
VEIVGDDFPMFHLMLRIVERVQILGLPLRSLQFLSYSLFLFAHVFQVTAPEPRLASCSVFRQAGSMEAEISKTAIREDAIWSRPAM